MVSSCARWSAGRGPEFGEGTYVGRGTFSGGGPHGDAQCCRRAGDAHQGVARAARWRWRRVGAGHDGPPGAIPGFDESLVRHAVSAHGGTGTRGDAGDAVELVERVGASRVWA